MKILFVENRFRTRIWEAFADCLINDGHQVLFWCKIICSILDVGVFG